MGGCFVRCPSPRQNRSPFWRPSKERVLMEADTFSSLFGYAFGIGGLSADGDAREIGYGSVTGNYFSALGVKPALGRLFLPGESEKPGEELLVVLGYSFWQSKFRG